MGRAQTSVDGATTAPATKFGPRGLSAHLVVTHEFLVPNETLEVRVSGELKEPESPEMLPAGVWEPGPTIYPYYWRF